MGILSDITQYSDDVLSGHVVACQKHRWACLRFLKDLERAEKENWEWVFVEEHAERFIKWMSLFKHRKGTLAGARKVPVDFEKFVFGNIYGWRSREDHSVRRFRVVYAQTARKNSKSMNCGIVSLYELACMGESNGEVFSAATKKAQAGIVWSEASWLYQNSFDPALSKKFVTKHDDEKQTRSIRHIKSDSVFTRLSKEDSRSGDGTNPHCT
jgi:phage terminase large subunit-like protein